MRLSARRGLTALLLALAVVSCTAILFTALPFAQRAALALGVAAAHLFAIRILRRALAGDGEVETALADGLASLRDRDYSVSIAEPEGKGALPRLVRAYNGLGEVLRAQRQDLYQRELMLDTVIQATPLAMVLTNANGTILYANLAARQMFGQGHKLEGDSFAALLERQPAALREALSGSVDTLFTVELDAEPQVFHLSQRNFQLNSQPHRLSLLKQLTRELNAQEVAIWKKVIRVIAHEINNSVAPIASLAQSGQRLAERPDATQLKRVFAAIEERMAHLSGFVEAYSRFAKLPHPRQVRVAWRGFIEGLRTMSPFELDGPVPDGSGVFDATQLQQVLLNLLKNAGEAGSTPERTEVSLRAVRGGWQIEVRDRGSGMVEEVLANALLPFYSTKQSGTGLGLTLCREIVEAHGGSLELANREGGGVVASIRLPDG